MWIILKVLVIFFSRHRTETNKNKVTKQTVAIPAVSATNGAEIRKPSKIEIVRKCVHVCACAVLTRDRETRESPVMTVAH